ncbi:MAG: hypothetical protein K8953_11245, partial [Proteobacteria bacterium]|nr:hypothetical protein [Pseudomonadota bacterium]
VLAVRKALAETCRTSDMADGCAQAADGLSGKSVADCSANPYDTTDTLSCAENPAFTTERMVRNTLCISSEEPSSNPFDALCGVFPMINTQRVAYCNTPTTAWEDRCSGSDVTDTGGVLEYIRANVCISNLAIITTAGADATVVAGSSLFNTLCNGLQVDATNTVAQARIDLAARCTTSQADDVCDAIVDATANVTARKCGNDANVGDPFQVGCRDKAAFAAQRDAREMECTMGGVAGTSLCTNAIAVKPCIEDPHGSSCGTNTPAQTARDSYCRGNGASPNDSLCDARQTAICMATDTPFASTCGPNMMAQTTYCLTTTTADDPLCKGGTVNYTAT